MSFSLFSTSPPPNPPAQPVGQRCPLHNGHLLRRQLHPELRELKAPLPQCKWFLFAKEQSGTCTLGAVRGLGPSSWESGARQPGGPHSSYVLLAIAFSFLSWLKVALIFMKEKCCKGILKCLLWKCVLSMSPLLLHFSFLLYILFL